MLLVSKLLDCNVYGNDVRVQADLPPAIWCWLFPVKTMFRCPL